MDKQTAVVAGHICLDVIPTMDHLPDGRFSALFQPGKTVAVGGAAFSTGGPVSNTGLALHRLGIATRLMAKIGGDLFGQAVIDRVTRIDPALAQSLAVTPGETTSYSVIISPPGVDRIFLHCPGANDAFTAADIDYTQLQGAALFHFGYPPLMRRMYSDGGESLAEVLRRAKEAGATTSVDMAFPDPSSDGGRADWRKILARALPYVDIFLPSIEELLFMLRREEYDRLGAGGDLLGAVTPGLLSSAARELIGMGAKVIGLKLGARGFYLRTAPETCLPGMGRAAPEDFAAWAGRELWAPCYKVRVAGTTGSGDATIAGFLAALLRDFSPWRAATAAVAVGACNVEAADALSGLRSWDETMARIERGWPRLPLEISAPGWAWSDVEQLWIGPAAL